MSRGGQDGRGVDPAPGRVVLGSNVTEETLAHQIVNQLSALILTSRPELRETLTGLSAPQLVDRARVPSTVIGRLAQRASVHGVSLRAANLG